MLVLFFSHLNIKIKPRPCLLEVKRIHYQLNNLLHEYFLIGVFCLYFLVEIRWVFMCSSKISTWNAVVAASHTPRPEKLKHPEFIFLDLF